MRYFSLYLTNLSILMPRSNFIIERECEICGKKFLAKTIYSRYCSRKCINAAYRKRKKEADAENRRAKLADAIPNDREYISITEATYLFKVSRDTVYRLVRRGIVPSIRLGPKTIRLDREALKSTLGVFSEGPIPISVDEITPENSYSIGEISAKFKIGATTVYKAIKDNNIPTKQIGRYVYAPMSLINKLFS